MSSETHKISVPAPSDRAKRLLLGVVVGVLLVAAAVLLIAWLFGRRAEAKDHQQRADVLRKGPKLAVIQVQSSLGDRELTLPGDARGYEQITLYAKIAGYMKSINVERGDHVARGQVLGVIESPENDQDVISARSDAVVKHINAERARALVGPGIVSAMDKDLAENDERRAQAELERLNDVKSYETVRAPFPAVVTARYVDPGALVPAATGATSSAQPLFDVAEVDRLRVFVYVGQDAAPFVDVGNAVTVWQDELPEKQIHAQITRCAAALDPRTRRMQCEIVLDNRSWGLLPGTSVHVRLQIHAGSAPYVPNEALVIRDGQTSLAVVKAQRIHLVQVELGATDGKSVRILSGISPGDVVGINVPVELDDDSAVQPVGASRTPSKADLATNPSSSAQAAGDSERESSKHDPIEGVARGEPSTNGSAITIPKPASNPH